MRLRDKDNFLGYARVIKQEKATLRIREKYRPKTVFSERKHIRRPIIMNRRSL
jgi:hypothetical protein